jgi:acyl-CoA thioesterase FadM
MYPLVRLGIELALARRAPRLPLDGVHVSRHTCWPWDIDPWRELNNGRTLTLYDLGRVPLATRTGLIGALRANRWGLAVAGTSIRYRRRVRAFDRIEMRSAYVGRDARFIYVQQAMYVRGEPVSGALIRSAVTSADGIVATDRVMAAMGAAGGDGPLPHWIAAWTDAEGKRPWPPEI